MARAIFHHAFSVVKPDVVMTLLRVKTKHGVGFTGVSSQIFEFSDEFHQNAFLAEKILPENKLCKETFLLIYFFSEEIKKHKERYCRLILPFATEVVCTARHLFFMFLCQNTCILHQK